MWQQPIMQAGVQAPCPLNGTTAAKSTAPRRPASHLHILATAQVLQREVVALKRLYDCIVHAHLGDVAVLVRREGQVHGLPRLLNLVQRFFHLHRSWEMAAEVAPSSTVAVAGLDSKVQFEAAAALAEERTSASFCARSTISVTASTQLCSSSESKPPRVKLLSMTKRLPVACSRRRRHQWESEGAWPHPAPTQQQRFSPSSHASARPAHSPSAAAPSVGLAWLGGASPEPEAAPAPWPWPSPPGRWSPRTP